MKNILRKLLDYLFIQFTQIGEPVNLTQIFPLTNRDFEDAHFKTNHDTISFF